MEGMIIYDDALEGKIFMPKAIRKTQKTKKNKRKYILKKDINNIFIINKPNETQFDLDNISIDEINKDFLSLASKEEEEKCFDELNDIISNYNFEQKCNNHNKIKRPINNIFY